MPHKEQVVPYSLPSDEFNDVPDISGDVIDLQAQGNIDITDAQIRAKDWLNLYAGDKLTFLSSVTTHSYAHGSYQTVDSPTHVESGGTLSAIGRKGFRMTGTILRSCLDAIIGSTEADTDIEDVQLQRIEVSTEKEDGGLLGGSTTKHTTHITTSSFPTHATSDANLTVVSGKEGTTRLTGSYLKALEAVIFEGEKVESNARIGINSTRTESETASLFSSSSSTQYQEAASIFPSGIQASQILTNTRQADYRGTDFIADVLYDNTEEGACFGLTLANLNYFYQTISDSPLAHSDVGCKGGFEVMAPCGLAIHKLIRQIDHGEIKLNTALWNKNRTQIIGKFAETTYQLKQWQESWNKKEQFIPDEALVVVAFAITIATQGTGGTLFSSLVTNATSGSMVATATGMSMASAAFTTVCTQAATSFLSHGDILQTGKDLFSSQGLRSLGTAVATAGLIGDGGSMASLSFAQRLAVNGFRSLVKAGVSSAIERRNLGETLKDAGINTLVDSISGALAKSIGEAAAAKDNPLTYGEHKAAHFGVGALAGSILDRDHPLAGAIKGGIGAMMAEVIAESLVDRQHLQQEVIQDLGLEEGHPLSPEDKTLYEATYREKLHPAMNTAKLVVASVMASFGHDPSIAVTTATNALENNFANTISLPAEEVSQKHSDNPSIETAEERGRSKKRSHSRPLLDPETYNPAQAAQECTLEEFVEDRLAYERHQRKRSLSPNTRQRLTQQYGSSYCALRQMEADRDFMAPGSSRLAKISSLSFEELRAERMQEMDPQSRLPAPQRQEAEKIIKNEYETIRGRAFDSHVGVLLPLVAGKVAHSTVRSYRGAANQNVRGTTSPSATLEGLDLAETSKKLSKDQPWTIRKGQEYKGKITGKGQRTGGVKMEEKKGAHAIASYREAITAAKRSDVEIVTLDRGINRLLPNGSKIKPNTRPDVAYKTNDGKIHQREVPSKTDRPADLIKRMKETNERLPKEMQGSIDTRFIKETKNGL